MIQSFGDLEVLYCFMEEENESWISHITLFYFSVLRRQFKCVAKSVLHRYVKAEFDLQGDKTGAMYAVLTSKIYDNMILKDCGQKC